MEQEKLNKLQRAIISLMVAKDKVATWHEQPGMATAIAQIESSMELLQDLAEGINLLPPKTGTPVWYRYHNEKWRLGTAQPYGIIPSTDPNETYNWYESDLQWKVVQVAPPEWEDVMIIRQEDIIDLQKDLQEGRTSAVARWLDYQVEQLKKLVEK